MTRHRIPLLRDRHTHPLLYAAFDEGLCLSGPALDPGLHAEDLRSAAVQLVRGHAANAGPGWSVAYGWNSGRYPLTREDFAGLPPLVVFNLSLHGLVVNDAGRALLGRHDPDIAANLDDQGWIERHLQRVLNLFAKAAASPERLRRFYRRLLEDHGVWYAEEMLLVDEQEVELFEEAGLSDRTRFWAAPDLYARLSPWARARVHGVKLFADGALGARTAALGRAYRGSDDTGLLMYEDGALEGLLRGFVEAGTPVAVHAIGDRAIDQVVAAAGAAGLRAEHELRIEHAQFISEGTALRAKGLGIRLCMQPNFSQDSADYVDRLPEGYAAMNNPFRMLVDRAGFVPGADLCFGSDGMPHGVGEGLRASLFPPLAGQALTLGEFVAGYCGAGLTAGHIDVEADWALRRVSCRVVVPAGG